MSRLNICFCTLLQFAAGILAAPAALSPPASASNATQHSFAQAILANDTVHAAQVIANTDPKILGGAISQATDLHQSYDINGGHLADFAKTLASNIAAAVSQAKLSAQTAIQGYAYALSYSQNDLDNEILLAAVASIGQVAQLLTEAKALGVNAGDIKSISTSTSGIQSEEQKIQTAIAANDIFGTNAQLLQQASGNVSAMADELVTTAALARAAALEDDPQTSGALKLVNVTNDRYFAQLIVTALNQAKISSEVQAAVFTQALARSLNTEDEYSEAPDIIITAAVAANQAGSVSPGFAQAQPNRYDPIRCFVQLAAQQISSAVDQATTAARRALYGQAATDALANCNS